MFLMFSCFMFLIQSSGKRHISAPLFQHGRYVCPNFCICQTVYEVGASFSCV